MTEPKAMRVKHDSKIRLKDIDPNDQCGLKDKDSAMRTLQRDKQRLAELQGLLYAENKRALLVVLQGMDTSGKDGCVTHVLGGLSPMGCQVNGFVAPSAEEADHDFLWRVYQRLPRYGNIGVFNRSHYEDVLAARVRNIVPETVWRARFGFINQFESLITGLGTKVLKIFLHIDRDEQRDRLEERLKDPAKSWKYDPADLEDRRLWEHYQEAYEDVFAETTTTHAPWYIVPANRKWVRNAVVAHTIVQALEEMDPRAPKISADLAKTRIPR